MPTSHDPAISASVSLCMIVKNEGHHLARCLASVQPYVDEIIVVDTGSTDQTVAIAQQYGAKVSHFDWCEDFAAARNFSIRQATGSWILVLDADQELILEAEDVLTSLGSEPEVLVYALKHIEVKKGNQSYVDRLFRNLPEIGFVGCLQEKICPPPEYLNQSWIKHLPGLEIKNHGHDPASIIPKAQRNIRILEANQQRHGLSLKQLNTLAEMYEIIDDLEKALEYRQQAFEQILPDLIAGNRLESDPWVARLLYTCGLTFLELEDNATLQLICQRGLAGFPNHPPLNYLAGLTLSSLGFSEGAIGYFQHCLHLGESGEFAQDPLHKGFVSSYAAYGLGTAYIDLKQWQQAKAAFLQALAFDPDYQLARERLAEIAPDLSPELVQDLS
jgi:tetratricopeptide (TPR) repeat protein